MEPEHVRIVPVADRGVLVEFVGEADDERAALVRAFDRRVRVADLRGVVEVVPAYVNAMVLFDPLVTDHEEVATALAPLAARGTGPEPPPRRRSIPVCYGHEFGPDIAAVAEQTGLDPDAVIAAHTAAEYRVVMFGFAPGVAYLSGVEPSIRLPRKQAPVRDVPAGSVIIAGAHCLVMTVTMPTGWWVIGRAAIGAMAAGAGGDLDIDVGDIVTFEATS